MNQLDIKANNTLIEVQGTNERFAKKVEEVTDRWMTAMGSKLGAFPRVTERMFRQPR